MNPTKDQEVEQKVGEKKVFDSDKLMEARAVEVSGGEDVRQYDMQSRNFRGGYKEAGLKMAEKKS